MDSISKLLYRIASEIKNQAQEEAPYLTGNLRNDIQVFDNEISSGKVRIGNTRLTPYAEFVHRGTGLYGPHRHRIVPVRAKALKTPYGYFKSVKGQKANPYMKRALEQYKQKGLERALKAAAGDVSDDILKSIRYAVSSGAQIRFRR